VLGRKLECQLCKKILDSNDSQRLRNGLISETDKSPLAAYFNMTIANEQNVASKISFLEKLSQIGTKSNFVVLRTAKKGLFGLCWKRISLPNASSIDLLL
jgi:hypothetical protein